MKLPQQKQPVLRNAGAGPAAASGISPSANLMFKCQDGLLRIKSGGDSTLTMYPCAPDTPGWQGTIVKSTQRTPT